MSRENERPELPESPVGRHAEPAEDYLERDDVVVLLRSAADGGTVPPAPDGANLARRAVRRVRTRRAVLGGTAGMVAAGVLVVALQVGPFRVSDTIHVGDAAPSPSASASATPEPSPSGPYTPSPSASPSPDPEVRYLPVAGGELPELPGFAHGVVEISHSEYTLQGGLQYTLPPGGWALRSVEEVWSHGEEPPEMVWDVSDITSEPPGALYPDGWQPDPMAGSKATIELRVADDAASWQVPARDSGAWTAEVPGADLVVITRSVSDRPGLARWDVQVRRDDTGWTARLDFTDDEVGDQLATAFVGNLMFPADGEPEWFDPTYVNLAVDGIVPGTPQGWQEVTNGPLTFAVPADWAPANPGESDSVAVQLEGAVASTGFEIADGSKVDLHWRVLAQDFGRGGNVFSDEAGCCGIVVQHVDIAGSDFATAQTTLGPFWGDASVRAYSTDVSIHKANRGNILTMTIEVPGDEQGLVLLRQLLGSLRLS